MSQVEISESIEYARKKDSRKLDLSSRDLTRLPREIESLPELTHLDLSHNKLTHLPEEILSLKKLNVLILSKNRLTRLPDEIGLLTNLRYLSLHFNQLGQLPAGIRSLTELKQLRLHNNQLTKLPAEIGCLTNLKDLDLNGNKLTELPPGIGSLTNLLRLSLGGNQLTQLSTEVGSLTNLLELFLRVNRLSQLPPEIGLLTNLTRLDVRGNQLTHLPAEIGLLTNLTRLDVRSNQLTHVPAEIGFLKNLTRLDVRRNQLTHLLPEIGSLTELNYLNLGFNQLTHLPPEIGSLTELTYLNLEYNQLTHLPPEIGSLTELTYLSLGSNQLTQLPAAIGSLTKLTRFRFEDNQLPETISGLKIDDLLVYLRSIADVGPPFFEGKLLLVGEGAVGKSSLLAALNDEPFIRNRSTTHGIELAKLSLAHPDVKCDISLNAWDFGGQKVYRATHQFFFSPQSLYLLLWNARLGADQCQIEDWIKMIKLRVGKEARILIVATHAETGERISRINKTYLDREYGEFLVGFHEVDSETNFGIKELKDELRQIASELPHMGLRISPNWAAARKEVLAQKTPFIKWNRFSEICSNNGLSEEDTSSLANFLHILGNLVFYSEDDGLKETVILQPEWMSKAIGFVLEDKITNQNMGVLPHARLREIWYDHGYPDREKYDTELHPFFLRLMEKHDVSYRIEDTPSSLVAEHVPEQQPELPWQPEDDVEDANELRVICSLDDVPPGIIPWMIVRTHRFTTGKHWQNGMFLENGDHGTGFLELRNREFWIVVRAEYPSHFMSVLTDTLTHLIDQRWDGLEFNLTAPCKTIENGSHCDGRFRIKALKRIRSDGDTIIRCQECVEKIHIDELLQGLVVPEQHKILELLEQASLERESLHIDASKERQRLHSHTSEMIRYAIGLISSESKDCPRLFTLLPENLNKINPLNWGKVGQRLTLWCEHPDNPHPLCPIGSGGDGEWEFKKTDEWLMKIAPYARFIATCLVSSIPVISSSAKMLVEDDIFNGVKDHLALMKDMTGGLLKAGMEFSDQFDDAIDGDTPESGLYNSVEGSGLRVLHHLLLELDGSKRWGGIRRTRAETGDFLWLCPTHYREYDPGLPVLDEN